MLPSNPAATGSAGTAFETKVAAACLTLLLTRGQPPCLGAATLHTVHLQAGHLGLGWNTDDLLLEAINDCGQPTKVALQVKRSFELSIHNSECIKTLHAALTDFRNSDQFNEQLDAIGLVTSSLSTKLSRGLRTLLDCARASLSSEDMVRRLAITKYLSKPVLEYYNTISRMFDSVEGGAPSDDELWRFLQSFHVVDLDLNVEGGITEATMRSLLTVTLRDGDVSAAHATWNELIATALSDAGRAMSYTREKLPNSILERYTQATTLAHGVARLLEDSSIVADAVRTTISERTSIPRRELTGKICELIETSPLVFVTGAAGAGKSALVKSAFEVATQGSIGFAFRAVSLAGVHINEVLHRYDLTLIKLQAQTAMHCKKVLWVDSVEQLIEKPAEQRSAFLDLLRKLKCDTSWRIVVTCRDYSAETVRSAFFSEAGLTATNIEVGELTDVELNDVAVEFPSLMRPLSNDSLRSLLRNPFYLDKASKMNWPSSEPLPTTERAFRDKVWREVVRRNDEDMEVGLPKLRDHVMVEVALRRAKALDRSVVADDLDPRALSRLVRDSLLQKQSANSDLYAPAHDVFEDWALTRWLDLTFARHDQKLDLLLNELSTYPALRRAYRKWLCECLDVDPPKTDSEVLAIIQNQNVTSHWRDDTLVAVLQSGEAYGFINRNSKLLIDENGRLFRRVIHILRIACRSAVAIRDVGGEGDGYLFIPKGKGWLAAAECMEAALPILTEDDLPMIVGFLEEWVLITKFGIPYPRGATSIAKVAWHWLKRSSVRDVEEKLAQVILSIPLADSPTLTNKVEETLMETPGRGSNDKFIKLIFDHLVCDAVVRDLPDLAFRVAEKLLGLDRRFEELIVNRSRYQTDALNCAFGLGSRNSMDDFPPSAFHGPYLRMLSHHPDRGLEFIVRFINRACEAYAHPDNSYQFIEQPALVTILLGDQPYNQLWNWRLWGAYRGMSVVPDCFQSALMALEYWLLDKAKRGDTDLENILLDLLRETNNVAITAVVAGISAADTELAEEAAYALITCPTLLKADLHRSSEESSMGMQLEPLGISLSNQKNWHYDKERKESAKLHHQRLNLEDVAIKLQTMERFRNRVWALIDRYKSELPPENEQDEQTKLWRLQLHRMDTRNLVETERTEEGCIFIGSCEPEPDLQALIEEKTMSFVEFDTAISLLDWGRNVFAGRAPSNDWNEFLEKAKNYRSTKSVPSYDGKLLAGGSAYVATVCVCNHWSEMTSEQQQWCALTIFDAIEADADVSDWYPVSASNPNDGSRPAAFAVSALFGKSLPQKLEDRLLPALAKAVSHGVEEVVAYAMQGVGRFLWNRDRELALTCVQALVTITLDVHDFLEKQRSHVYSEEDSKETFTNNLRLRLREFITRRETADVEQIANLDLARWPGGHVAKHIFGMAVQNAHDSLFQRIMKHSAIQLVSMWETKGRSPWSRVSQHGDEESFDPHIERKFLEAICLFALRLKPADSLDFLEPIYSAASRFPEDASNVVKLLITYQSDSVAATTLWTLWQRFADDMVENVDKQKIEKKNSDESKMLQELFLGINWAEQRDWPPLRGETDRLRKFFQSLPPMIKGVEYYAYYLAKIGTPTLPDALVDISAKLEECVGCKLLNETAIFYLEEIMTRLIYTGNCRIRTEKSLRLATLRILDAMVEAGSSSAFKLRDDFLTPIAG